MMALFHCQEKSIGEGKQEKQLKTGKNTDNRKSQMLQVFVSTCFCGPTTSLPYVTYILIVWCSVL